MEGLNAEQRAIVCEEEHGTDALMHAVKHDFDCVEVLRARGHKWGGIEIWWLFNLGTLHPEIDLPCTVSALRSMGCPWGNDPYCSYLKEAYHRGGDALVAAMRELGCPGKEYSERKKTWWRNLLSMASGEPLGISRRIVSIPFIRPAKAKSIPIPPDPAEERNKLKRALFAGKEMHKRERAAQRQHRGRR